MAPDKDTAAAYELIYWPGIPGRGEHVRLALEAGGAAYGDAAVSREGPQPALDAVGALIAADNVGDAHNPPPFAPPALRHGDLLLSQTPAILAYLGPRLGLAPSPADDPAGAARVQALALTALDGLSNEVHDCHHPIGSGRKSFCLLLISCHLSSSRPTQQSPSPTPSP